MRCVSFPAQGLFIKLLWPANNWGREQSHRSRLQGPQTPVPFTNTLTQLTSHTHPDQVSAEAWAPAPAPSSASTSPAPTPSPPTVSFSFSFSFSLIIEAIMPHLRTSNSR
jgi:hypothetical protein